MLYACIHGMKHWCGNCSVHTRHLNCPALCNHREGNKFAMNLEFVVDLGIVVKFTNVFPVNNTSYVIV